MRNATAKNKKYYDKNRKEILAHQSKKVVCHVCTSVAKHNKRKNHLFNLGICQQIADLSSETANRIKQLEQQKKRRATDSVVELLGGQH